MEAQTALGKRNTFCETRVYVPLQKFCKKTAPLRKISLKSDNPLLNYDQKRFLKWLPSAILNF